MSKSVNEIWKPVIEWENTHEVSKYCRAIYFHDDPSTTIHLANKKGKPLCDYCSKLISKWENCVGINCRRCLDIQAVKET